MEERNPKVGGEGGEVAADGGEGGVEEELDANEEKEESAKFVS